jgi:beta-phosphoglucomutase
MSVKKGIIFDLDGVIVDTAKYHYIAWKKIAEQLGISFSKKDNELLKGVSRIESLEIILKLGNKHIDESIKKELLTDKNNHYLTLISNMSRDEMLPGIYRLLTDLKNKKIPFALGSASKNANKILTALQIQDWFSAIVDGNDVQKAKPDPEVFLIAANRLKILPENCLVIEDAKAGVEAAKNAGMKCIGIGNKKVLQKADLVLSDTGKMNIQLLQNMLSD